MPEELMLMIKRDTSKILKSTLSAKMFASSDREPSASTNSSIILGEHAGHVWGERERVVPVEQITD